jgi:hypothetical protein
MTLILLTVILGDVWDRTVQRYVIYDTYLVILLTVHLDF